MTILGDAKMPTLRDKINAGGQVLGKKKVSKKRVSKKKVEEKVVSK